MGLPHLKDYYIATLLDQIKFWFQLAHLKHWSMLEHDWAQTETLSSLLLVDDRTYPGPHTDHNTIAASLQALWLFCEMQNGSDTP